MSRDPQTTQTAPSVELLPCPFCGALPLDYYEADRDGADRHYSHSVYALECSNKECPVGLSMDVDTWQRTKEETAKRWNTRHHLSRPAEEAVGARELASDLFGAFQRLTTNGKKPRVQEAYEVTAVQLITAYGNARARGALEGAMSVCTLSMAEMTGPRLYTDGYADGAFRQREKDIAAIRALVEGEGG
jgi:hypothetical protein